jgi:hypothetical protein
MRAGHLDQSSDRKKKKKKKKKAWQVLHGAAQETL